MISFSSSYILNCFFFNDTATTEIYTFPYTTLFRSRPPRRAKGPRQRTAGSSPGWRTRSREGAPRGRADRRPARPAVRRTGTRSEEHTSELQSHSDLVCRLLLEKKKKKEKSRKRTAT